MTAKELRAKAQELYNGGYDFELGDREQNIRILEADDRHYEELKREIIAKAAELGISPEDIVFE